jgi:hypothetical protein
MAGHLGKLSGGIAEAVRALMFFEIPTLSLPQGREPYRDNVYGFVR